MVNVKLGSSRSIDYNKTNQLHPSRGRTPTRWLFLYFSQQAGAGYLRSYVSGGNMSIDFSKYNDEELFESWTSIDDIQYPERAITIYKLLVARGRKPQNSFEDEHTEPFDFLIAASPILGDILADMRLEQSLCIDKEKRVVKLIQSSKNS
jgi:hypothetical protein